MSTSSITPMALVSPLAEGVIAMAMISTMSTMTAMATTTSAMSVIHTSGGMAAAGGYLSPEEELKNLNAKIRQLSYAMKNQADAMEGTREHRTKLMKEYGLTVTPSVVEMAKYPKLRATDRMLKQAEKNYDSMELRMMFMNRRKKQLEAALGIRPEEPEYEKKTYTVMSKHDSLARDVYGKRSL